MSRTITTAATAAALLALAGQANAAAPNWDGTIGNWHDASNWSSAGVPSSGDSPSINSLAADVTIDGGFSNLNGIDVTQGFGDVTINNYNGTISGGSWTFGVTGTYANPSNLNINSDLVLSNYAMIAAAPTGQGIGSYSFVNIGAGNTLTFGNTSSFSSSGFSNITNFTGAGAGSTLINNGDFSMSGGGSTLRVGFQDLNVVNNGVMSSDSATGRYDFNPGASLTNNHIIDLDLTTDRSGLDMHSGGFTNSGSGMLTASSRAWGTFDGDFTNTSAMTVSGQAGIRITGSQHAGTIVNNGSIVAGALDPANIGFGGVIADLTMTGSGTIDATGGRLGAFGQTYDNVQAVAFFNQPSNTISNTRLALSGDFDNSNNSLSNITSNFITPVTGATALDLYDARVIGGTIDPATGSSGELLVLGASTLDGVTWNGGLRLEHGQSTHIVNGTVINGDAYIGTSGSITDGNYVRSTLDVYDGAYVNGDITINDGVTPLATFNTGDVHFGRYGTAAGANGAGFTGSSLTVHAPNSSSFTAGANYSNDALFVDKDIVLDSGHFGGTENYTAQLTMQGAGRVLEMDADTTVTGTGEKRAGILGSASGQTLINRGLMIADEGHFTIAPNGTFENHGTVNTNPGATLVMQPGLTTVTNVGAGSVNIPSDGRLAFSGTFQPTDVDASQYTTANDTDIVIGSRWGAGTVDNHANSLSPDSPFGFAPRTLVLNNAVIDGGVVDAIGNTSGKIVEFERDLNGSNMAGLFINGAELRDDFVLSNDIARVGFDSGATFTGDAQITGVNSGIWALGHLTVGAGQTVTFNNQGSQFISAFPGDSNAALTIEDGATIQGDSYSVGAVGQASAAGQTATNNGLISANGNGTATIQMASLAGGGGLDLPATSGTFTNNGTVEAANGGLLHIQDSEDISNYTRANNELSGGTWAARENSEIQWRTNAQTYQESNGTPGWQVGETLDPAPDAPRFVNNRAEVILDGANSIMAPIDAIANNYGAFRVLNGRDFDTEGDLLTFAGELEVGLASDILTHGTAFFEEDATYKVTIGDDMPTPAQLATGLADAQFDERVGQLFATGDIDIEGSTVLDVDIPTSGFDPALGTYWDVAIAEGSVIGTFDFAPITVPQGVIIADYSDSSRVRLLVVVPSPSTACLLSVAGFAALRRRRNA